VIKPGTRQYLKYEVMSASQTSTIRLPNTIVDDSWNKQISERGSVSVAVWVYDEKGNKVRVDY
jgi:hypothetical protein